MVSELSQRGIEFGFATSDDAAAMVNFHNAYYGTERKPEHWLWEYKTYKPDKSVFAFARDHERIIATQAIIPVYLEVGAELVLSGKSENSLLLPPYRGSGIMPSLYEHAVKNCIDRGIQFLWGFTAAAKLSKKFTYYPIAQIMMRPGNIWIDAVSRLRDKSPLWRRIGSVGKLILKSAFKKHAYSGPNIQEKPRYEVKKGKMCDEKQLQSLYQRLKETYGNIIYIRLDREYLKWRVREHPFVKYDEYQVYQNRELCAYAFVAMFGGVAAVSDLTSEDTYATSILLKTIIKDYAKKAGRIQFLGNSEDLLAAHLPPYLPTLDRLSPSKPA